MHRTRKPLLVCLAALAAACLGLVSEAQQPTPQGRPNIVVLLADDLGYGDLACYGSKTIQTPHLDKLASQGLRLTSCYSAAPVCSPSRAALLTGLVPQRLGIPNWIPDKSQIHLKKEEITIARLLKGSGYATCMVGKWHCSGTLDGSQPTPGDHGFDHWMATQNNAAPSHANPNNFIRNGVKVGPMQGYSSAVVAEEAIGWLKQRKTDQPFFLFVAFHEPHEPIASDATFLALYPDEKEPTRAQYRANVTQMDVAVGRLMQFLDEAKLAENTLVIFTSDNGPEGLARYKGAERSHGSAGELRANKLHLYEGGIRVAGIVRWSGIVKEGTTSDAPVGNVDLFPTLGELAGIKMPTDRPLDGISIAPLLRGEKFARNKPLYWQYNQAIGPNKVALRDGDWKILADAKLKTFELYNLATDPREQINVAEKEPARMKAMMEALQQKFDEVNGTKGMSFIKGGTFKMGDDKSFPYEAPVHEVTVKSFWMDKTEVTVAQFAEFVKATGYKTEAEKFGWSGVFDMKTGEWTKSDGADWRHPDGPKSEAKPDEPVVQVSWSDAVAYAKWAGKRLPTEAEWEYACRGGLVGKQYQWGDEKTPTGKYLANWWQGVFPDRNTAADGYVMRAPVGKYPPNEFGLHDMIANVWEWCADWYTDDYYAKSPRENPHGPANGVERVLRGGSWMCSDNYCTNYRPAARSHSTPDTGLNNLGFRCVKDE